MNVLDAVKNNSSRILELLVAVPGQNSQHELDLGLLTAVKAGHEQCADILIKAGASPNYQDRANNVALVIASEKGHTHLLQLLLAAGAYSNTGQGGPGTALHYAAKANNLSCVEALIGGGAIVDSRDSMNSTPLIVATRSVAIQSMKLLIKADCNLNLTDSKGRTALHYACHKALADEVLLAAGADPNIPDEDDNHPIHMAATEGFDSVVMRLLAHGCNPDVTNCFKKTAAHYLAMKNHCKSLNAIALKGGKLNLVDAEGNTPLMCAIQRNRPEAVKLLLMANCEHETSSITSTTLGLAKPLSFAFQKRLFDIAKLMVLTGAELSPVYEWISSVEAEKKRREEELAARPYVDSDEEEDEVNDDELEEALEWFREWLHKPHSLQQLCRLWIRHHVGPRLLTVKDMLPVPPAMVDYITLKEVEDHPVDSYLI